LQRKARRRTLHSDCWAEEAEERSHRNTTSAAKNKPACSGKRDQAPNKQPLEQPHLTVMRWNFKEELVASSTQAVGPDDIPVTTYYQYDSKGKRLRKITENDSYSPGTGLTGPLPAPTPTLKNQRVYIEGYEYYEDFGSGEVTHSLSLMDEGRRFVMVEDSTLYDYRVRYQHPNHQSSCTLETDDIGRIITHEEYHPFGTTSYQATNSSITAAYKRYRYTGQERDDETGLNYHNARYYIPWLGRWLNPDPIGIGDGVNVYSYCRNNPVAYHDPEGTQTALNKNNYSTDSIAARVLREMPKFQIQQNPNSLKLPERSKFLGKAGQDFGFGNADAPNAAKNNGMLPGEPYGKKFFYNPNAMDGSSTKGHYFYQNPVPREVTTRQVINPQPVPQPQVNNNINANLRFNPNNPVLTPAGIGQINNIAQQIPNSVNVVNGQATTNTVTTPFVNDQGLPGTTTTVTQTQPQQTTTVASTVTINLTTSISSPTTILTPADTGLSKDITGQELLDKRYDTIRQQLINQGVPAASISMGAQTFGVPGLVNGNLTGFNIQTNTTVANGNQITITTTTRDFTYE